MPRTKKTNHVLSSFFQRQNEKRLKGSSGIYVCPGCGQTEVRPPNRKGDLLLYFKSYCKATGANVRMRLTQALTVPPYHEPPAGFRVPDIDEPELVLPKKKRKPAARVFARPVAEEPGDV